MTAQQITPDGALQPIHPLLAERHAAIEELRAVYTYLVAAVARVDAAQRAVEGVG